ERRAERRRAARRRGRDTLGVRTRRIPQACLKRTTSRLDKNPARFLLTSLRFKEALRGRDDLSRCNRPALNRWQSRDRARRPGQIDWLSAQATHEAVELLMIVR